MVTDLLRTLTRNSVLHFGQYSQCRIKIVSPRTFVLVFPLQIGQRINSVRAITSLPQVFYLCTLPVPSPPMSLVTSETFTRLKSPMTAVLQAARCHGKLQRGLLVLIVVQTVEQGRPQSCRRRPRGPRCRESRTSWKRRSPCRRSGTPPSRSSPRCGSRAA